MKYNFLLLSTFALFAVSCNNVSTSYNESQLVGQWQEIMPVNKSIVQGIDLKEGGIASSIGMATLKYNNWRLLDGKGIILSGESIGNGQTISFSDTLDICSLKDDTLTLGKGGAYRIQYKKINLIGGSDSAMGYKFSTLLNKKIRIFEEGVRLLSATDSQATSAGYAVFAEDSSKVELFLPEQTVILDRRTRPDGTSVWNQEDDDTYSLQLLNEEWMITRRGMVLYISSGLENVIHAEFTGESGKNLSVSFFNTAEMAQVSFDGISHVLYQYRTASGYGYKNPFIDIRGKGKELTLTDLSTNVKEKFVETK